MSEEKLKRIVAAGVAIAVVTLFLLTGIMIYQIASMSVKKREAESLQGQIDQLTRQIEGANDDIELWMTKWKIEERARQKGYVYKGMKND